MTGWVEGWSFLQQVWKLTIKQQTAPLIFLLLPLITWFSTNLAVCLTWLSPTSWRCWCILAWISPLSVSPWAILVIPMVFTIIPFHADSSQKQSGSSPYLLRPTPFNKPLGCLHPVFYRDPNSAASLQLSFSTSMASFSHFSSKSITS